MLLEISLGVLNRVFSLPLIEAHMNPAITMAVVATGRMDLISGLFYVVAQMIGAVLGSALMLAVYPHDCM